MMPLFPKEPFKTSSLYKEASKYKQFEPKKVKIILPTPSFSVSFLTFFFFFYYIRKKKKA